MAHKMNCIIWVQPNGISLSEIAGNKEIPFPDFLKKLWAYWKQNKLYRVETIAK